MTKRISRLLLVVSLFLAMSLSLSSCEQLQNLGLGKGPAVDVPPAVGEAEKVELSKDEKGLDEIDRQYLAYAKDKWSSFEKAVDKFGSSMDSYLDRVFNEAAYVNDQKEYVQTRDKLMEAVHGFEAVDPAGMPEEFKNLYGKLFLAGNRARYMINIIQQHNATNLPEDFDAFKAEIAPWQDEINKFFSDVDATGLAQAAANISPVDWQAEEARETNNRNTFNVADYGLKWGASRWDVMGVEGLRENGYNAEVLSYKTKTYQYDSVRNYHFNEYGQLDYYTYDIDGSTFDRGNYPDDPLYDDIYELAPMVMYHFVKDSPALRQQPYNDGMGNLTVSFDQPAETVLLTGAPDGSITLTVTGKTVEQ
jgi:hypothetical protein